MEASTPFTPGSRPDCSGGGERGGEVPTKIRRIATTWGPPDPVAMSIALDPSVVTSQTENDVDVETTSELTRGMTVVDRHNVAGNERNKAVWALVRAKGVKTKVVWAIDNARWKQALFQALR